MKVKKQKRHRKAVTFYRACFGFREPFKILCDGTFVHHLLVNKITPADTALANILSAQVKLFTTTCAIAEMKSLGENYADSVSAARNLLIARCNHERRKSAVACITDVIGENNPEHFFVASQDAELRSKFHEIPGVPLIFALRNALFLEQPSPFQQQFAKAAEEARSGMTEQEYKLLKARRTEATAEEIIKSSDANEFNGENRVEATAKRKKLGVKDTVQFKRKRAKGPNPLSCKKKKTPTSAAPSEKGGNSVTEAGSSRKRRRSRKKKNVTEPTS